MKVSLHENKLCVRFAYDAALVNEIKKIPGREWNPIFYYWSLPYNKTSLQALRLLGFPLETIPEPVVIDTTFKDLLKKKYPFLFDYQLDATARAIKSVRLLIADEMGLGKTIETFAAADYLLDTVAIDKIVVICPASIKWQVWRNSIEKFFSRECMIIGGSKIVREALYRSIGTRIFVLNYELLLRDFDTIAKLVKDNCLILDEASWLKNPKAKRTRLVKLLQPKYLFASTGTPIENKLEDVFTIGNIVSPGWMSKRELYSKYVDTQWQLNIKGQYFPSPVSYRNKDVFIKRVYEIAIRRKRIDVKDFPPKAIYTRDIKLTEYQKKLTDVILRRIASDYKRGEGNVALAKFVLLQMLEDSTELLRFSEAKTIENLEVNQIESPKLKELEMLLEELTDKKIVIFTKFKKMVPLLCDVLPSSIPATSDSDKQSVIQQFRDNFRFLVATDAFSYGVDMPFATTVINFDIPWNPARLQQRIDRCYRVTSKEQLDVFNFVSEGIESYMYQVMQNKTQLVETFDEHRFLKMYIEKYISEN